MTLTLAPQLEHCFATGPIWYHLLFDSRLQSNTLTQPTSTESRWPSTIARAVRAVQSLSDLLKAAELSVTVVATTY